jgi:oligogalacturonide transporter
MLVYTLLWLNGMNYWFYLAVYLAFEIIAAMVLDPVGNAALRDDQRF